MITPLPAGSTDGAGEPVLERAVKTAVCRLPPIKSPPRCFNTTRDLAAYSEVDHGATHNIAFMMGAHSGRRLGEHTPRRPPNARDVRAAAAANVYHALFSMNPAVDRCFTAHDAVARISRAGRV